MNRALPASAATPVVEPIRVSEAGDTRLAPYCDLRERDLRGHGDRFVAEGEVVLRVLLESRRFAVDSILVSERRLTGCATLLAAAPPETPVYVAGQAVMDTIVGFHIHRGLLAIGRRLPAERWDELLAGLPSRGLVLGLVGLANHDNVGGVFRNAAAFGVDAVLLDRATCDPLYRKALRVSVGGALKVRFARVPDAQSLLDGLAAHGFGTFALSPGGAVELGAARPLPGRRALLLGAEGPGLPPEIMAQCETVRIRMAAGFDSLNVATSAGIALYALAAADDVPRGSG